MLIRHKYVEGSDWHTIPDPVGSKKYDGAAFALNFDSEGKPSFISRRESVKGGFPDRTEKLPHLSDVRLPEFAGRGYHVELIHSGWNPEDEESHANISGILNSLPPKAIGTQKTIGPVRAVLLDAVFPKDLPTYESKMEHLKILEQAFNKPGLVFTPEYHIGQEAVSRLVEETKNRDSEGVIVTSLKTPETLNVRHKVKHFGTYNLKVSKIMQEVDIKGSPKQSAGALLLVDANNREVCAVGSGFTKEQRAAIWKNPKEWLGRHVQIKAMSSTANRLRHPVFNGDADGDLDVVEHK